MNKIRKSSIDLVPFIDTLIILLFFYMLNASNFYSIGENEKYKYEETKKELNKGIKEIKSLRADKSALTSEIKILYDQVDLKNKEITEMKLENDSSKKQIITLNEQNYSLREEMKKISSEVLMAANYKDAIASLEIKIQIQENEIKSKSDSLNIINREKEEFKSRLDEKTKLFEESTRKIGEFTKAVLKVNEDKIKQLLDNVNDKDNAENIIESLTSSEVKHIIKNIINYSIISNQYLIIDIKLKTSQNQIFINDNYLMVAMSNNKDEIQEKIEKYIENQKISIGGRLLVLLSCDDDVYKLPYDTVWKAIEELGKKYGAEKFYKSKTIF